VTPEWAMQLPWNMLLASSKYFGLDVNLLAAITMQESGGKTWLTRFEQSYIYLMTPAAFAQSRGISEITETTHQKTSWGLMQIMGGVAREQGYTGDLPELARPAVGLRMACTKMKAIVGKYGVRITEDLVSAWNAGSPKKLPDGTYANQKYVVGVMRYYQQLAPPSP
jgi:hypothetical protein